MSADAEPLCPVCRWLAREDAADCRNCGARLLSGFMIGAPPPRAQQELDNAIAAERRRYALRVAVRAAHWRGKGNLASLARLAGGDTPPSDAEIADAAAAYDTAAAAHPAALGVDFALSRLVAGETGAIEFMEISPEGLSVYTLVADELGVPTRRPGDRVSWTDVLPELPADDDDLRTYLLAGGLCDPEALACPEALAGPEALTVPVPADPALAASVAAITEREVTRLLRAGPSGADHHDGHDVGMTRPPLAGPDTILVCRTQRWPALEAAASRARAVMRPVAEIFAPGTEPLSAIVSETIRRAPLRYDYCLVLAEIDQLTGMVRPAPSLLFPAGTTGQPRVFPARDVPVRAPSNASDRLVLPVVARRGDDPANWPAVGVGTMDGTVAGHTQLRVRLEAPGQVSLSASPRLVPSHGTPGWPGALEALPDQVAGTVVADVVLLAELGGRAETIAHRMNLLRSVVDELDRAGVKVAVVGYREHWDKYAMPGGLIVSCGLGDAADIRPMLARNDLWQAVEIRDRHAAPVEDALDSIAQPDWAWRPGARHLLVLFAARPPHPSRVDDLGEGRATTCLDGFNWRDILGRLRREQDVECMAVLPEQAAHAPAGEHAEQAWKEFSQAGLFYAERSPTADIVHAIGIDKADERERLPLAEAVPDDWPEGEPGREGSR